MAERNENEEEKMKKRKFRKEDTEKTFVSVALTTKDTMY